MAKTCDGSFLLHRCHSLPILLANWVVSAL
jgi:hypothetical protein